VLRGHKPSSIRWLLTQVPYRNQLNFHFRWIEIRGQFGRETAQFSASVLTKARTVPRRERLHVPSSRWRQLAPSLETIAKMKSALDDDLNTAEAQAAMFDMLRKANTALDAGQNQDGQNKSARTT
jgi:cysteinyl-tRNA synthetase